MLVRFPFRCGAELSDCFIGCDRRAGRKPLRKRTIASGGSQTSVGKSLRKRQEIAAGRQRSRDLRAPPTSRGEAISPAVSRVSGAVVCLPTRSSDKVVQA